MKKRKEEQFQKKLREKAMKKIYANKKKEEV